MIKKTKNSNFKRLDWVDILRGIAIIFVFIGHSGYSVLQPFAYMFHLYLFFILSGFFATNCTEKYRTFEYIKKKFLTIMIPLIIWAFIMLVLNNIDSGINMSNITNWISNPGAVVPNYWFLPALFTVSIVYYFLKKIIKKDWIILIVTLILYCTLGEKAPFSHTLDPLFNIINNMNHGRWIFNYINIGAINTYLFWYVLGVFSFKYIKNIIDSKDKNKFTIISFNTIGLICTFLSCMVLLKNVYGFSFLQSSFFQIKYVMFIYQHLVSIIILIAVVYISTFLTNIELLKDIGKNTLALLGLEFYIRGVIVPAIFALFNVDILSMPHSTIEKIIIIFLEFVINMLIINKFINKSFPILNGKLSKKDINTN